MSKSKAALQGRLSKQRYRARKQGIYNLLGNKCITCGEKDERVLQIDHRYSDGNKERGLSRTQLYKRVENNTRRYQLLCANCNWRKRTQDYLIHKRDNTWWRTKRSLLVVTILGIFIIALGVYHAT